MEQREGIASTGIHVCGSGTRESPEELWPGTWARPESRVQCFLAHLTSDEPSITGARQDLVYLFYLQGHPKSGVL